MKLIQILAPAAGFFAVASAGKYDTAPASYYTTVITTAYTTYCPSPTTIVHHNTSYIATTPGTIVIPDYPCTTTLPIPPPVLTTAYSTKTVTPTGTGYFPPHGNSTSVAGTGGSGPKPTTYPAGSSTFLTTPPTKTPVGPTSTPSAVVTAGAAQYANPIGMLVAAGLAAMAL